MILPLSFFVAALFQSHQTPQAVSPVTVYQHCNYEGWAARLRGGNYTAGLLKDVADYRRKGVSSIKVAPGYQATLFPRDKFKGKSLVLTSSTDCLVSEGFNDRMVSIRIKRIR